MPRQPDYLDDAGNPHYLSDGKTDPVIYWKWRVRDPKRRSGWRELSWRMTPEHAEQWAKSNDAEIQRVEGSEEVRTDVDGRQGK